MMTLATGIGWGDAKGEERLSPHRYSIDIFSLDANALELYPRRSTGGGDYEEDHELYSSAQIKDMEGKRICAQIGSTGSILASTVKNATVANFDQIGEAFMELKMNGCDSVMVDKTVTLYYLTKHNDEDIMMVPHVYNPKQNGFAVAKNNKALLEKLNKGLKIIKENGEYDKIYEKWLGKKPQASQQ